MKDLSSYQDLPRRLEHAIEHGLLPDAVTAPLKRVLERLNRPLRMTLMGLPGSGKSTLINLLAGENLVPEGLKLPSFQVQSGSLSQTICMLPDGTEKTLKGIDLEQAAGLSPVFVTIETDLPALSKISFLEVSAGAETEEQRRAIAWACKRTDIAVWCSQGFGAQEQALWAETPDAIKDHGLLVLTKADLLGGEEARALNLANVQKLARDEFYDTIALSPQRALQAKGDDGAIDRDVFRQSGAPALIAAIKGQVDAGRRADFDFAEITLEKYCADLDLDEAAPDDEATEVEAAPPEVEGVDEAIVADDGFATTAAFLQKRAARLSLSNPISVEVDEEPEKEPELAEAEPAPSEPEAAAAEPEIQPEPQPAAEPETDEAPADEPEPAELFNSDQKICAAAASYLQARAADLAESFQESDEAPASDVVTHCLESVEGLMVQLASSTDAIDEVKSSVEEAHDLIVLMQMEEGSGPADDALTILLQLRRDLIALAVN